MVQWSSGAFKSQETNTSAYISHAYMMQVQIMCNSQQALPTA